MCEVVEELFITDNIIEGTLVTGVETANVPFNSNSLMIVTALYYKSLRVKIIDTLHDKSYISEYRNIEEDMVKPTSFKLWEKQSGRNITTLDVRKILNYNDDRVEGIYILKDVVDDEFLNKEDVNLSTTVNVKEISPEYILSEDERKVLEKEISNVLIDKDYHPKTYAINKIIDEWVKNKGYLINLISKHPNYNGKFQIAFHQDFDRNIDPKEINIFINWINSYSVRSIIPLKEVEIEGYTYKMLYKLLYDVNCNINDMRCLSHNIKYKGKTLEEYKEERDRLIKIKDLFIHNESLCSRCGTYISKEESYKVDILDEIVRFLQSETILNIVTENFENMVKKIMPDSKIVAGMKLTRAINKILTLIGLSKHPEYNKRFAKFSDSVNPLTIKRHTVLSVHPVDYLLMSNGNSWSSCHAIDCNDEGCYCGGTLSYMLDGTSMVFYTVDAKAKEDNLELEPKINRNMFFYDNKRLVQSRLYPQDCDHNSNDLYEQFRHVVQKIIADCLEVNNMWKLKKGKKACSNAIYSYGVQYKDYNYFSTCNISTLKDFSDEEFNKIPVGKPPICVECGRVHSNESSILCYTCRDNDDYYTCFCCGEDVFYDDAIEIDGRYYCNECVEWCVYHNRYEVKDENVFYYFRNGDVVCLKAIEESDYLFICDECGEAVDIRKSGIKADDYCFCDEICAENHGYTKITNEETGEIKWELCLEEAC